MKAVSRENQIDDVRITCVVTGGPPWTWQAYRQENSRLHAISDLKVFSNDAQKTVPDSDFIEAGFRLAWQWVQNYLRVEAPSYAVDEVSEG